MTKLTALAIAATMMFSASAQAEDRIQLTHTWNNETVDVVALDLEKNVWEHNSFSLVGRVGGAEVYDADNLWFWRAGVGTEYSLDSRWTLEASVDHVEAKNAEGFVEARVGARWANDYFRVNSALVKAEAANYVGELSAEVNLLADQLSVGLGATFDRHDYIGTQAFVALTW